MRAQQQLQSCLITILICSYTRTLLAHRGIVSRCDLILAGNSACLWNNGVGMTYKIAVQLPMHTAGHQAAKVDTAGHSMLSLVSYV